MTSGWTIARAMWLAQRPGFLALLAAAPLAGLCFHLAGPLLKNPDARDALSVLPLGLSLFIAFILCNFTETDRRGRGEAFPARLFTLPVNTWMLVAAPLLFSVVMVLSIYDMWAKFALPELGRELPLSWPALYLAAGMTGYQAIVWSLARFRLARLLALGVGGTVLAVGWEAFRDGFERELITDWLPVPAAWPVRSALCGLLALASLGAVVVARFAVESQRRGGSVDWQWPRRWWERLMDDWPRRSHRLKSPGAAQFWYEWRRHGVLLPLATTSVLLVIFLPAPFLDGGVSASGTNFTLIWIVVLPLLLALALGKGFGKADLWAREPALPLYFATRPLQITEWIAAKLKAAALAAVSTWLVVIMLTSWWLVMWADIRDLLDLRQVIMIIYPKPVLPLLPLLGLGVLVILTWRLLVGSLFIGLSGKAWMLGTAVCGVFTAVFGAVFFMLWLNLHPKAFHHLLRLPVWLPWLLAGMFILKAGAALVLAGRARRQGWVTLRAMVHYIMVWLAGTAFLMLAVWLLVPVSGWLQRLLTLGCLLVMPLASLAYAPAALARNRGR